MKLADLVVHATTQAEADFRKAHFQLHLCGLTYLLGGWCLDYLRPTRADKTKWMIDLAGEHVTCVDNTVYTDLSIPGNRAAIVRAAKDWIIGQGWDGYLVDTLFECAPNQEWYAVQLMLDLQAALPDRIICPNFGDVFSWTHKGPTPQHALAASMRWQFCQVALDFSATDIASRLSRMTSAMKERLDAGYTLVVGIYDPFRKHEREAAQLMRDSPLSTHPALYWHYNSTDDPAAGVESQWCNAL